MPSPGIRRRSLSRQSLFWLLVGGVILAPVWFGSNAPVVWGWHAVYFGGLLVIYGLQAFKNPLVIAAAVRLLKLPLMMISLVLLWAVLQSLLPVPDGWRAPVWEAAAAAIGHPVEGTISIFPEAGMIGVIWIVTAVVVFFLAHELGSDTRSAGRVCWAIVLSGGAIALYGLAVYFAGNSMVLWQPKHAYPDALTSTFINRNTYAAYAGLVLTVTFGLLLQLLARRDRSGASCQNRRALSLALGCVFVLQSGALVFTASRAGCAAAVIGVATVTILHSFRLPHRRTALAAFVLGLLLLVGFAVAFGGLLASRFARFGTDFDSRVALDESVLAAIKSAPWTGYGLGTFEQAYPPFRALALQQSGRWEYAHNSWLEALMTLGIPAGVVLWLLFVWMLSRCIKGSLSPGDSGFYCSMGAGVAALTGAQSLIDFPFQIQGFALPCLTVVAVAVAHSWPRPDKRAHNRSGSPNRMVERRRSCPNP